MVSYIIWLKSGECIEGLATAEEIDRLRNALVNHPLNGNMFITFEDTDGSATVALERIEAIAINSHREVEQIGFK